MAERIEDISTRWPLLGEPLHVVMRYAPAIRSYLGVLMGDDDDADEVCQELLARVLQTGFVHATPERGRFRMYLKASVRNAAWMFFRRRARAQSSHERLETWGVEPRITEAWAAAWQGCVVERAVAVVLERGGASERVLRLVLEHEDEDSQELAARLSTQLGQSVRPDALRKQLSRARRAVSAAIVDEVAATLEAADPEAIETELRETGLWTRVGRYLEPGWQARFRASPPESGSTDRP